VGKAYKAGLRKGGAEGFAGAGRFLWLPALRAGPLRHAAKTRRATSPGFAGGGKGLWISRSLGVILPLGKAHGQPRNPVQ
jgi:hypothetical protein